MDPHDSEDPSSGTLTKVTVSCVYFEIDMRLWLLKLVVFLVPQVGVVPLLQQGWLSRILFVFR